MMVWIQRALPVFLMLQILLPRAQTEVPQGITERYNRVRKNMDDRGHGIAAQRDRRPQFADVGPVLEHPGEHKRLEDLQVVAAQRNMPDEIMRLLQRDPNHPDKHLLELPLPHSSREEAQGQHVERRTLSRDDPGGSNRMEGRRATKDRALRKQMEKLEKELAVRLREGREGIEGEPLPHAGQDNAAAVHEIRYELDRVKRERERLGRVDLSPHAGKQEGGMGADQDDLERVKRVRERVERGVGKQEGGMLPIMDDSPERAERGAGKRAEIGEEKRRAEEERKKRDLQADRERVERDAALRAERERVERDAALRAERDKARTPLPEGEKTIAGDREEGQKHEEERKEDAKREGEKPAEESKREVKEEGNESKEEQEEHKGDEKRERNEKAGDATGDTHKPLPHKAHSHSKDMAIYIYSLPANLTNCTNLMPRFTDYAAEVAIPSYFKEHGYVVSNPEQADLFYVPLYHYCVLHNVADNPDGDRPRESDLSRLVYEAYDHIRKMDYWDRYGGADHVWTFTQPHGYCGMNGFGDMHVPEIQDSIMLVHWGLEQPEYYCDFKERVLAGGVCTDNRSKVNGSLPRLPCFVPEKDIVIANMAFDTFDPVPPVPMLLSPVLEDPHRPRNHTLFFAGAARMYDPYYSHGVRQTLVKLFPESTEYANHSDFRILQTDRESNMDCPGECPRYPEQENHETFRQGFENSTFCIATTSGGWGQRAKLALMHGCIPVVVADYVQMEYEDILPWREFSIRIPQYMLYRIPEGLKVITDDAARLEDMQRKVACVYRWFSWQEPYGRAGEALVCSLLKKLHGQERVKPYIDWNKCKLICEVAPPPAQ